MVRLAPFFALSSLAVTALAVPYYTDGYDGCDCKEPNIKHEPQPDTVKCRDKFEEIIIFNDQCFDVFDKANVDKQNEAKINEFFTGIQGNADGFVKTLVELVEDLKVNVRVCARSPYLTNTFVSGVGSKGLR